MELNTDRANMGGSLRWTHSLCYFMYLLSWPLMKVIVILIGVQLRDTEAERYLGVCPRSPS